MKIAKLVIFLLIGLMGFTSQQEVKAQQISVDFNLFYNKLSPYGRWIDNPRYGRVWAYNEPGFRPYYTRGHWDYTDLGWSWASDYDWGWAPFHYGRWEEDPYYGWIWIPGYEWAPAWVSWSEADGYYGWAPLGFGIDIHIGIGSIPRDRWVFIPRQYITSNRFYNYCAPFSRNDYYIRNGRRIDNIYGGRNGRYMMGPNRYEVERVTRSRIEPRRIDYYNRRSDERNNNNNNIYRQNERRIVDNREMNDRRDNNLPNRNENNIPNNRANEQRSNRDWQNRTERNEPATNSNNLPAERERTERNQESANRNNPGAYQRQQRTYPGNNQSEGNSRQRNYNNERQSNGNSGIRSFGNDNRNSSRGGGNNGSRRGRHG